MSISNGPIHSWRCGPPKKIAEELCTCNWYIGDATGLGRNTARVYLYSESRIQLRVGGPLADIYADWVPYPTNPIRWRNGVEPMDVTISEHVEPAAHVVANAAAPDAPGSAHAAVAELDGGADAPTAASSRKRARSGVQSGASSSSADAEGSMVALELSRARAEPAALREMSLAELRSLQREKIQELGRINDRIADVEEEERVCVICLDRAKDTAVTPCGHRFCGACATQICNSIERRCSTCRADVTGCLRLYG